jgi:hypothetical protein
LLVIGRVAGGCVMELIVDQRRVGLLSRSPPNTMELEKGGRGGGGSFLTRLRAAFIEYGIAILCGLATVCAVRATPWYSDRYSDLPLDVGPLVKPAAEPGRGTGVIERGRAQAHSSRHTKCDARGISALERLCRRGEGDAHEGAALDHGALSSDRPVRAQQASLISCTETEWK